MLPQQDATYLGREVEGHQLAVRLTAANKDGGTSLVLLGSSGMGKSSLAADVGWQLRSAGALPGGALWVDVRGASSTADLEMRFCIALELQHVRMRMQKFAWTFLFCMRRNSPHSPKRQRARVCG